MKNVLLLILDGWGYSERIEGNAILMADTPNMDSLCRNYPHALLEASGEAVGLPPGQMGNSEVGHLNLGAGRIVYQELTRITKRIETGEFYQNQVLLQAMNSAKKNDSALHLVGLVSDGGVHSHFEHLLALLQMTRRDKVDKVFIHAILDGRDTVPYGAKPFIEKLDQLSRENHSGYVATVSGRYYAMDRDRRWDRVERAYRAYVNGEGLQVSDPLEAVDRAYARGEADEFVQPTVVVDRNGNPLTTIRSEDSVIFFNFRPDRVRQISRAFIATEFPYFNRGESPPYPFLATMTEYDRELKVPVVFSLDDLRATLGEIYSVQGIEQMRIAETEKYAHVTFFFNGGREKPFDGEERIMVPSPRVATYDLQPEMSAPEVTNRIIDTMRKGRHPLIVANYANADMVGHSGIMEAAVKAVQAVDNGIGAVFAEALKRGWQVLICADHGNAEQMKDGHGATLTAHSANPVPFLLIGSEQQKIRSKGILADVAPTILHLAGIDIPPEMSGNSMLVRG
ncbi:MAG: 2,3-bisphosphoglycerate-independent phosphoglycerate mutase [Dethiobacteria bacterium]|nr:2,3-bisphosphoglycerate-independent phosphoglycerate mutase [Dethiobacteria bacterium]